MAMLITTKSSSSFVSSSSICIQKYPKFPASNLFFLFRDSSRLGSFELQYHAINQNKKRSYMAVYAGVDPGSVVPPDPSSFPNWKMWIVGMLISAILPFWKNKLWPLIKLKDRVESIMETADEVAEVIEKVAEGMEEVAEEVAGHLPEGGQLKKAALFVEDLAKLTAKDAHLVDQFIDKVEEVEKEAESLIESAINQAKDNETKDQHN